MTGGTTQRSLHVRTIITAETVSGLSVHMKPSFGRTAIQLLLCARLGYDRRSAAFSQRPPSRDALRLPNRQREIPDPGGRTVWRVLPQGRDGYDVEAGSGGSTRSRGPMDEWCR